MAKEKAPPPPAEDIPAWFMTYSDVITLLMTFFILLLTFSTTEPDRFDRIQQTIFSGGTGSGMAGEQISGPEMDSFIQRVRPRAARMAMVGSEMPPYLTEPSKKSVGQGIKSVTDEEAQQDVMTTNQFELEAEKLVTDKQHVTAKGMLVAGMLAGQLRSLPVNLSLQVSSSTSFEQATTFVTHLYHTEKIRPAQVGISVVGDVTKGKFRFSIERFE